MISDSEGANQEVFYRLQVRMADGKEHFVMERKEDKQQRLQDLEQFVAVAAKRNPALRNGGLI